MKRKLLQSLIDLIVSPMLLNLLRVINSHSLQKFCKERQLMAQNIEK